MAPAGRVDAGQRVRRRSTGTKGRAGESLETAGTIALSKAGSVTETLPQALKVSRDRKVSPFSVWRATKREFAPQVANSFGLASGPEASCPDATEFCTGCYATRIERNFPFAARLVTSNLEVLKACGNNVSAMVTLLRPIIEIFKADVVKAEKKNLAGDRVYRIHWDGDFYSRPYAAAWATVARENPDVAFWAYTRSFRSVNVIDILASVPNITVYLSTDRDNWEDAKDAADANPDVWFAFCAKTWEETEALARKVTGRNAPRCPEQTGKVPMVNAKGVGACVTCGMCIFGRNNVRFAVKH